MPVRRQVVASSDLRIRLACWVLACVPAACGGGAVQQPPVILVSIDTLRADHLELYGYERETAPFLRRLGESSIVFDHAFTAAPWTLIAHMTMLTGLYPRQHRVVEGDKALAPEVPLLAERLSSAGYHTIGLYHPGWIHERHGFARGFDVFRSHSFAGQAEEHVYEELDHLPSDRPTFLFLHVFDVHHDSKEKVPHTIYSAPPPFDDFFLPGSRDRLAGKTFDDLNQGSMTEEDRAAMVAMYDDGIRYVDSVLERVFDRLERDGLLEKALVIVTSDHGEGLAQRSLIGRARGFMTGHGGPWQEGLHVPLIVHLPGDRRAGERVQETAHHVDVVATVLDFLGLPPDPQLPGHSLLQPLSPSRLVQGGIDPIRYVARWPEKWINLGTAVGRVDLERDPQELDVERLDMAEFEDLWSESPFAPGSVHAPLEVGQMPAEERQEMNALGYGGTVDDR